MTFSTLLILLVVLLVGAALGLAVGWLLARQQAAQTVETGLSVALEARAGDQAVVRDGIERLHRELQQLDVQRASWQGELREQVEAMQRSTFELRRETTGLSTALRRPQVRGSWGEMHLRRTVELAGLVGRCDFDEQVSLQTDDGRQRPDLVVHLSGGRQIVVDSKVPLDAFLTACEADPHDQPGVAAQALERHARQVRTHVSALSAKTYWKALPCTPEFVVLFVPGEQFLSAALDVDPSLLNDAADQRVILATPSTLIGLLRTIAWGWKQEALSERAAEIHQLGRELHERLGTMGGHLDTLGRSLNSAADAYNKTIGSLESRVLVTARRLGALEVSDTLVSTPRLVEQATRAPSAAELVDDTRAGVTATRHRAEIASDSAAV